MSTDGRYDNARSSRAQMYTLSVCESNWVLPCGPLYRGLPVSCRSGQGPQRRRNFRTIWFATTAVFITTSAYVQEF